MRYLLFLLTTFWTNLICSAPVKVAVDPRLELSGIVCYLAGAEEYAQGWIPQYTRDIDTYFGPYREHALIEFIKKIRKDYSIAYDAVPSSGLALKMDGNNLTVRSEIFTSEYWFDERWNIATLKKYVCLLNEFCKATDFMKFYQEHTDLYDAIVHAADSLQKTIHFEWFRQFWGQPIPSVNIYVSPASGMNNYAILNKRGLSSSDNLNIVIGCHHVDAKGIPVFNIQDKIVLIHELCHHYTNPLYSEYAERLQSAANRIFPHVETSLRKIGYGNAGVMCCEALNELFIIMYLRQYEPEWAKYRIEWDENNGFIWMSKAVCFMQFFTENRQHYPVIKEFMSELVNFYNGIANRMQSVLHDYENRFPLVVSSIPGQNSIVATDITKIEIKFSTRMFTGVNGIYSISPDIPAPNVTEMEWAQEGRLYVIKIDSLKPNTKYGIKLPRHFFIDNETGHRLKDDFILTFSTSN